MGSVVTNRTMMMLLDLQEIERITVLGTVLGSSQSYSKRNNLIRLSKKSEVLGKQ